MEIFLYFSVYQLKILNCKILIRKPIQQKGIPVYEQVIRIDRFVESKNNGVEQRGGLGVCIEDGNH